MDAHRKQNLVSKLKVVFWMPLVLMLIFIVGAMTRTVSSDMAQIIFWLALGLSIISLFFIVPLAKAYGRSAWLWGIGTVFFFPLGSFIAGFRLLRIANDPSRS